MTDGSILKKDLYIISLGTNQVYRNEPLPIYSTNIYVLNRIKLIILEFLAKVSVLTLKSMVRLECVDDDFASRSRHKNKELTLVI